MTQISIAEVSADLWTGCIYPWLLDYNSSWYLSDDYTLWLDDDLVTLFLLRWG